jgi:hypothetical protein
VDRKLRGMRKLVSVLVILCMLTSLAAVTGPAFAGVDDEGLQGASVNNTLPLEEDPGSGENPPIYGVSDLKTSHEFPAVTGSFEVIVPKEGEEEGTENKTCKVSFTPSIEEGGTPFFTAIVLGSESILTIRNNNLNERADVDETEDIYIEHEELLSTEITVSEEYTELADTYYEIIYQVEFYATEATADPNALVGELKYRVRVYDSPLLGIEVDYRDKKTTHYGYHAAYIEEDIFNSTVEVNLVRESGEDDPGKRAEPVEGVPTNIFYYWGASDNKYCTFKPTDVWVSTGANGTATFIIGDGANTIMSGDIGLPAEALYGKLVQGSDSMSQYYTYPDLKDFKGTLKVKVINTFDEPLKDRTVQIWGGVKYDHKLGAKTNDQGIAEIRYPSDTISEDVKDLTITELPTFSLKWNLTQVTDNPSRIVEGHNAPLYLSPEVYVSEGYSGFSHMEVRGIKLQVYDTEDPERVLIETPAMAFQEKYTNRDITIFGSHRAYIEISPKDWAEKKLGIRAVVANKDEGAREKYQVRSYVEDKTSSRELYEPKKDLYLRFCSPPCGYRGKQFFYILQRPGSTKGIYKENIPGPHKICGEEPYVYRQTPILHS